MLVIVSDTHLTDRETGAPVTDGELTSFVRDVEALEPKDEEITLLLLGDIIDFLRSEQWESLWEDHKGAAPWTGLGPRFTGFEGSLQEERLLNIAAGVETRYSGFAAALKDIKKKRAVRITYVEGNHDFMLRLSSKLRAQVVKFLSLDNDPKDAFPLEYEDKALGIYAEHGHRYDPANWHQQKSGLWAIGDAIVLRIVDRFGALARQEINLTDATPLGRAIHEIDNVEPQFHIPLYIDWLSRTLLDKDYERKKLQKCWRQTIHDFLLLPEFREDNYGKLKTAVAWLRHLYSLFDVDKLLRHLKNIPVEMGTNYTLKAHLVKTDAQVRVFGHTHEPGVHALPEVDAQRRYYVNTGTWRRVIHRVSVGEKRVDFAGQRVSTYLVVRASGQSSLLSKCLLP